MERVAERFGLGRISGTPVRVPGGLSNELWRLDTERGSYAVKRMIANADRPGFVANVEAAYAVEHRAWAAGVPMPAPVPVDGLALARVDGPLYRVHRWVDGTGGGTPADAATLLAAIHAAGSPRWTAPPEPPWVSDQWGDDIARLTRRVATLPDRMQVVDSHRDLDPKNTLLVGGALIALDWDAAGPVGAVHETVAVALDWSDFSPSALGAVPREPWVFAGWVAAQGGWLDYQAGRPDGHAHVTATLERLRRLAAFVSGTPFG